MRLAIQGASSPPVAIFGAWCANAPAASLTLSSTATSACLSLSLMFFTACSCIEFCGNVCPVSYLSKGNLRFGRFVTIFRCACAWSRSFLERQRLNKALHCRKCRELQGRQRLISPQFGRLSGLPKVNESVLHDDIVKVDFQARHHFFR